MNQQTDDQGTAGNCAHSKPVRVDCALGGIVDDLAAALIDERDPLSNLLVPCQKNILPKCRCRKCVDERSVAVLDRYKALCALTPNEY